MADGVVQVSPDSSGKKVDTSELTRTDGTTVVERQRVVLGDDTQMQNLAPVRTDQHGLEAGLLVRDLSTLGVKEILLLMLEELEQMKETLESIGTFSYGKSLPTGETRLSKNALLYSRRNR